MTRIIAWIFATLSGLYLLIMGPMLDPLPFIDEGVALVVFLKSTSFLGYDVRRWIPFLGRRKQKGSARNTHTTIDV